MSPEALDEQLVREPFTPLRLTLMTGEMVDITDPRSVCINCGALYVFGLKSRGSRVADGSRLISLRHIVAVGRAESGGIQ